jgi:hypothetical protein
MSKHTPGPWFVHDFADPAVSDAPGPHDVTVSCVTPDHIEVASMGRAMTATLEEARANARLMAAAPDMLAALKHAQMILECDRRATYGSRTHALIRKAIAKATGAPLDHNI